MHNLSLYLLSYGKSSCMDQWKTESIVKNTLLGNYQKLQKKNREQNSHCGAT